MNIEERRPTFTILPDEFVLPSAISQKANFLKEGFIVCDSVVCTLRLIVQLGVCPSRGAWREDVA